MSTQPVRILAGLVLTAALSACAPAAPPPPPDTTAEDTAAINALRDAWVAAFNAADAEALANMYTEDAIDMGSNEPSLTGRAAIRDSFVAQFGMGKGTATVTSEELQLAGDWAYDRGMFTLTMTPAAGGDPMTLANDRYLVILRKQADGTWKLARLINNSPTPPAPAAAGS